MKQEKFDRFVMCVEPADRRCASAWRAAIGLQAIDGLKPSHYLFDLAKRNIERKISIDDVRELLDRHYLEKQEMTEVELNEEQADKTSANITKVFFDNSFTISVDELVATHERIFNGVLEHAGLFREFDLKKKEWLLNGDAISFINKKDVRNAVESDIENESEFSYAGMTNVFKLLHISVFASNLWLIHPFCEGNTRTIAVFMLRYLRSMGYDVDYDAFANYSWYFRNALVRANYKNEELGIDYDFKFLEKFFRNLMFGDKKKLKIKHLVLENEKSPV